MRSKVAWLLGRLTRKIWIRVVAFAALAIVAVGVAKLLAPYVPPAWAARIGADAVEKILSILATSMLAVTTFSLSIAVSAFSAAASTATPRATALLQEDRTTQNVLATFLGAFLFSLLGLIALRTEVYDEAGKMVLFLATLAVVALVVIALLGWIVHLMAFGRMGNTLDRVEAAASDSLARRLAAPCLGGCRSGGAAPAGATAVTADAVGYVQHVDVPALADCAERFAAEFHLAALPGSFVHHTAALLHVAGAAPDDEQARLLRAAFTLGHERTFDQDPRFGLIVLSEIASRALSPAVNDPGTAISVIGRLVRVLSAWTAQADIEVEFPRIHVPPLRADDVIEDAFRPIARDGAALIEVQIRLNKALAALAAVGDGGLREATAALAGYALERAREAGLAEAELEAIRRCSVAHGERAD
ncbi:MAG: DUF2254 domain-containing protein [Gammaproteobacteria bacterium]|nr:DUF2254 domain-containing protein [Gammaproteobacteria bacterium]